MKVLITSQDSEFTDFTIDASESLIAASYIEDTAAVLLDIADDFHEDKSGDFWFMVDAAIRPHLIQKGILREGSGFHDLDINIDGLKISVEEFKNDIILKYMVIIF